MLIDLHRHTTQDGEIIRRPITEISAGESPFRTGLQYSPPARGHWTVAHTPVLIPGSYIVFLCASACMRGVNLSVLEYEGMHRFSMIMLYDKDIYEGRLEQVMIDGISEIIDRQPVHPPVIMAFTSCIHHFIACDNNYIYKTLRERYPDIDFVRCYMIPTIRKGKVTPEELIHISMYDALESGLPVQGKTINIIGSNFAADPDNDYFRILKGAGFTIRDLPVMKEYSEYKDMARSSANIYAYPVARRAADKLERRLGQKGIYLPVTYNIADIRSELHSLAETLGIYPADPDLCPDSAADQPVTVSSPDSAACQSSSDSCSDAGNTSTCPGSLLDSMEDQARAALARAHEVLGDTWIAIDHEVLPRICSLARLLVENGFNLREIYADTVLPEDEADLEWLKANAPHIEFCATVNYACRMAERDTARQAAASGQKLVAIGQKAAYYTGTDHFINWLENNGKWGFNAVTALSDELIQAYNTPSDVPAIIQVKAWGCHCM